MSSLLRTSSLSPQATTMVTSSPSSPSYPRSVFRNALPASQLGQEHPSLQGFREASNFRASRKKEFSLVVVTEKASRKILLGLKHRGFGEGMYNSFGGKLEEGETPTESACRELQEETGIDVNVVLMERNKVGIHHFTFADSKLEMIVHVYRINVSFNAWTADENTVLLASPDDIRGCDEISPQWFADWRHIPLDNMFADDTVWLTRLLASDHELLLDGWFHFGKETNAITHYYLDARPKHSRLATTASPQRQRELSESMQEDQDSGILEAPVEQDEEAHNDQSSSSQARESTPTVSTTSSSTATSVVSGATSMEEDNSTVATEMTPMPTAPVAVGKPIPGLPLRRRVNVSFRDDVDEYPVVDETDYCVIPDTSMDCAQLRDDVEAREMMEQAEPHPDTTALQLLFPPPGMVLRDEPVAVGPQDPPSVHGSDVEYNMSSDYDSISAAGNGQETFTLEQKLFHALHNHRVRSPTIKEFKESYAFVNATQAFFKDQWSEFELVIDVAGGHGALAALFLLLADVPHGIVIDPADVDGDGVERAWGAHWKEKQQTLRRRYECLRTALPDELEAALQRGILPQKILVVACHACQFLSDETLAIVCHHGVHAAVMPCGQKDATGSAPWKHTSRHLGISIDRTMDLLLAGKIMSWTAGQAAQTTYDVRMKVLSASVTSQNRLILCRARTAVLRADADLPDQERRPMQRLVRACQRARADARRRVAAASPRLKSFLELDRAVDITTGLCIGFLAATCMTLAGQRR